MGLETATYLDALVVTNPDGTDQRSTADDHLRLLKACLKRSFPMVAGAVSASAQAISYTNDLSGSVQAQLNALRAGASTANFAMQAASASFATVANYALSASEAFICVYAHSASQAVFASTAGFAQSASAAAHAGSASFATLANDSNNLKGFSDYPRVSVANTWTAGQAIQQVNSSGAVLTPNGSVSTMFRHTMTASANTAISNPVNPRSGMVISIHLINGGSSTATWGSQYGFPGGVSPTLSTAVNGVDVFAFQYDSSGTPTWRSAGIGIS